MQGWKEQKDMKVRARQAAMLATRVMQESRRARCFQSWRTHVMDMLQKQQAFQRKQRAVRCALVAGSELARMRRRHALRKCTQVWCGWAANRSHARSLWMAALQRKVRMAWDCWRTYVRSMQRARQKEVMAVNRWRISLAEKALRLWRSGVCQQVDRRHEMIVVASAHMDRVWRHRVLFAWQQNIAGKRAVIRRIQVCLANLYATRHWYPGTPSA